MSKLYFRYAAMNAGKSTAVMQAVHNYKERGMGAFLIKPMVDTKGDNKIVSRIGIEKDVDLLVGHDDSIVIPEGINAIFVDEAQFLSKNQVDELYRIAKLDSIPVLCYGLRSDFMTNFFEGSKRLMEIADSIEELKTICRCGSKATINGRKVNGEFVFEGEQVVIDGSNDQVEYESLCGKCYLTKKLVNK